MRNLKEIKVFSTMFICICFIFGFSQIGAFALEATKNANNPPQPETGSENIEDKKETLPTNEQQSSIVSESVSTIVDNEETVSWINNFNQIEIPSNKPFSFLQLIEEVESNTYSQQTLSHIASAIYKAVLSTNFEIIERHISNELPPNTELGYEAKIVPTSFDFAFINPNPTSYILQFEVMNQNLVVRIIGEPFSYTYKAMFEDEEAFEPKTIVQYSSTIPFGQRHIQEEGKNGYLVKVIRAATDETGSIIERVQIAEDFYPPVHRIEVQSFITNQETTPPNPGNNQGEDGQPQDNQDPAPDTPEGSSGDSDDNTSDAPNQGGAPGKDNDDDTLWDKPKNPEKKG
ncbi:VanW family protein [Fredinandcohnia humi]